MFERFKRNGGNGRAHDDHGSVATADRPVTRDSETGEGRFGRNDTMAASGGTAVTGREAAREVRARQREEYGGLNWGSAFFGWLVAVGMAVILLAILSAAGTVFSLGEVSESEANSNAETIGIVGGILLIAILALAYYCGGYVSGRMSRFDGGRQGFGTWAIGLFVTIVLAVAGAIFGSEYNVLSELNLPRIPIDEGSLTTGAAIALVAVVVLTLLAAMGGGKAGERYHKKVDRVGFLRD
jgi:amino acid transporter